MTDAARRARLIRELRGEGVSDARVLAAIGEVPRHLFVPEALENQAYDNTALPIGHGQTISQPLVVGLMTQALEPEDELSVLEIGTGSGYQAAVLSRLFRQVYTIERRKPLLDAAEEALRRFGVHNVAAKMGDGSLGWPEHAPFARILVTAAAARIPPALVGQLGEGGVMVLPVGDEMAEQWVVRVRRKEGRIEQERLIPVRFVPLVTDGRVG